MSTAAELSVSSPRITSAALGKGGDTVQYRTQLAAALQATLSLTNQCDAQGTIKHLDTTCGREV